jgi:hypothetical protein
MLTALMLTALYGSAKPLPLPAAFPLLSSTRTERVVTVTLIPAITLTAQERRHD